MFEWLFKYPRAVFDRGNFVLLSGWPLWMLWLGVGIAAVGLAWYVWQHARGSDRIGGVRAAFVWLMQALMVAVVLFLLWHPALSVATLKPQQNIVAVLLDDSASMGIKDEGGKARKDRELEVVNSSLMKDLKQKFQVRLYRMSDHLDRIEKTDELGTQVTAMAPVTKIGDSLKQVVDDAASLPIGAIVLLSDGADNSGGVDPATISEVRRQRIPVHTIGFGQEHMARDVEITDVELAPRSLPESRLAATVHLHQHGYAGQKVKINVRDGSKLLQSKEVTLKGDGAEQVEQVLFGAGKAGVKTIETEIAALPNEDNPRNNKVLRLLKVDDRKPRILYFDGEGRWEFKFLKRAVEDDQSIELDTMLRTTENKILRQGFANKDELVDGFPTKVEDMFKFDGLILGSVDASYLKAEQQQLIKDFVDRRGGGVLFLGGRDSLGDGGYGKTVLNDLLPVTLPETKGKTYSFDGADVQLTREGRESLITRIEEDPDKNVERWKKLPYLRTFQIVGEPKPGAIKLAEFKPRMGGGGTYPLLVIEPYGRGRTAVFATGGSWRWQMLQPVEDMSHETFYRQLLRWLVSDTPQRVIGSTPHQLLTDDSHVKLRTEVRDTTFLPEGDATVEAHIIGPGGISEQVDLRPEPLQLGVYAAEWTAPMAGSYVADVIAKRGADEIGHDEIVFRREDGVAENFHVEQNKELLTKLSSETGGRYYKPDEASKLGHDISYSEAGITVRETHDLWDMPAVFLLIIGLMALEWVLRRKWGVI
jgi:uncharacterized membrane protein